MDEKAAALVADMRRRDGNISEVELLRRALATYNAIITGRDRGLQTKVGDEVLDLPKP